MTTETSMRFSAVATFLCVAGVMTLASATLIVPDAPASADLTVYSGEELRMDWSAPLSDGGSAVHSYQVEWDSDPGTAEVQLITTSTYTHANEVQTITSYADDVSEVQTVTTSADSAGTSEIQWIRTAAVDSSYTVGGEFSVALDTSSQGGSLQYSGAISAVADADSDRDSVEQILEAMSNVAGIQQVTRSAADAEGGYTWSITFDASMGDVPQMVEESNSLHLGTEVTFGTAQDGNILGGTFRLTFADGETEETTANIAHDASSDEMRDALQALGNIATVEVVRDTDPDDQGGYTWTISFTSDENSGNVPDLQEVFVECANDGDEDCLSGTGATVAVNSQGVFADGNELSGSFGLCYDPDGLGYDCTGISDLTFDASASEVKAALEGLGCIVTVTRTGPDYELGYSWEVSFVHDYTRTHKGQVNALTADTTNLAGTGKGIDVVETRPGTLKPEMTVATSTAGGDGDVSDTLYFKLEFDGELTGAIAANPSGDGTCDTTIREVQTVASTTTDTSGSAGDDTVSSLTYFTLTYGSEETAEIYANPNADGDCTVAAAEIESELELFDEFYAVTVTSASDGADQSCTWSITFDSSSGDVAALTVTASSDSTTVTDGPSNAATTGDDTLTVTDDVAMGSVDAIKTELEALSNVGEVTVTSSADGQADESCTWTITFDTNAGDLQGKLLVTAQATNSFDAVADAAAAASSTAADDTVTIDDDVQVGTSTAIGGDFTVEFQGQRTGYLAHDVSESGLETALEGLSTIGNVDVTRSDADENERLHVDCHLPDRARQRRRAGC
jgi:hypothetical protein